MGQLTLATDALLLGPGILMSVLWVSWAGGGNAFFVFASQVLCSWSSILILLAISLLWSSCVLVMYDVVRCTFVHDTSICISDSKIWGHLIGCHVWTFMALLLWGRNTIYWLWKNMLGSNVILKWSGIKSQHFICVQGKVWWFSPLSNDQPSGV